MTESVSFGMSIIQRTHLGVATSPVGSLSEGVSQPRKYFRGLNKFDIVVSQVPPRCMAKADCLNPHKPHKSNPAKLRTACLFQALLGKHSVINWTVAPYSWYMHDTSVSYYTYQALNEK